MANINSFLNKIGYGARSNLFEVDISGCPSKFFVKGAQLPGRTINNIPVKICGRTFNHAGETVYPEVTLTVINDDGYSVRTYIQDWMKRIQSFKGMGITRKENMVDKISIILNEPFFDNKTGEYILFNAYPTDLGQVDLSWDSQDTIQEYTVTITYDYWEFKSTTDTLDSVSKYGGVFT